MSKIPPTPLRRHSPSSITESHVKLIAFAYRIFVSKSPYETIPDGRVKALSVIALFWFSGTKSQTKLSITYFRRGFAKPPKVDVFRTALFQRKLKIPEEYILNENWVTNDERRRASRTSAGASP